MNILLLVVVVTLVTDANGAVFSAKIQQSQNTVPGTYTKSPRGSFHSGQKVLKYSPNSKISDEGAPTHSFIDLFYTVNISIGTPPQYFTTVIDISDTFPLFVPSVDCMKCDVPDHYEEYALNKYNSTLSQTYLANGTSSDVKWANVRYSGFLSRDTVQVGEVTISNQTFEEWLAYSVGFFGWTWGYDGVLGLAPPWNEDLGRDPPSFFSSLISQNMLDEPIISLKFPSNVSDEGELLFGGTNPDIYAEEPIRLSVVNNTNGWYWTVSAESITFNTPVPFHCSLPSGFNAIIDSTAPYIMLPHEIYVNITLAVGASRGPYWFNNIPCERRQELPTLTFTLGGNNFTISAFEYTMEAMVPWAPEVGKICMLSFMDAREFGFGGNTLYLSHPFLKGFYSVFDAGRREVGLAKLKK